MRSWQQIFHSLGRFIAGLMIILGGMPLFGAGLSAVLGWLTFPFLWVFSVPPARDPLYVLALAVVSIFFGVAYVVAQLGFKLSAYLDSLEQ